MRKLTTEGFIRLARLVHGNKYDYSKVVYVNNKTKVCIICPIHGEFWQNPYSHLQGIGCRKCSDHERSLNTRKQLDQFIVEAKAVHSDKDYDYSESVYVNGMTKLCIICPIHGRFWQTPHDHLSGCGCPKCSSRKFTLDDFIRRSREIHGWKYDYSKAVYVDYYTRLCLICSIHGEFWITPSNHLRGAKRGCPLCNKKTSILEDTIKELLIENKINYIPQYKTEWLQYQSLDFYLPDYNVAIECQGKQHFGKGGWSKKYNFDEQKERDERRYNLCKENNVKLLYFSNLTPKYEYFDKVYTDKNELLEIIRYL